MRLKHWVLVGFIVIGVLYVAHIFMNHGGMGGLTAGLGLGGNVGRTG